MGYIKLKIVRISSGLNQAIRKIFGYAISRKENMSIEGGSGGSVGAASVSGPSFVAPAFEAAPIGGIISAIINEGPVRGFMEGFRPMNVSDITTVDKGGTVAPLGEIVFEPGGSSVIQQAEKVAAAAWEGNELPVSKSKEVFRVISKPATLKQPTWEVFLPQAELMVAPLVALNIVELPKPQIVTSPSLEPKIETKAKIENRVSPIVAPTVLSQSVFQEQEEVEEKVSERLEQQTPNEVLEEENVMEKRIIVEDEVVVAKRRFDIKVAIKKAQELVIGLGLKKITGALVAKFTPVEYAGVRSQIIKEQGPDGSYQEIVEELAGAGEFESETAAQERIDRLVTEKKPAKYGKNRTPLDFKHVARIFKYRIFKPVPAHIEVIKRVIKKKVGTSQQNASFGEKKETNLEELSPDLAEVFQKAT